MEVGNDVTQEIKSTIQASNQYRREAMMHSKYQEVQRKVYKFRSRGTLKEEEGLVSTGEVALNPSQKAQVGNKSLLSKYQKQEMMDIKQGKNTTISQALRMEKAMNNVS